jgi:hypothetical protein
MTNQSKLKYNWIISTLYQSKQNNIHIDASIIKAVFNIPMNDAKAILNTFNKGA